MKKLSTLALAAAGVALMTGCSAVSAAAPAPSATPPATQPPSPAATSTASPEPVLTGAAHTMWEYQKGAISDSAFYSIVRKGTTTLDSYTDDDLAAISQMTCSAIANGETGRDIIIKQAAMAKARQDVELTAEMGKDVGFLVGSGVQTYCPDLLSKIIG
ncbi:MAG TPA: DUF732 domain-containing protein [Arthrobacter sp.]